MKLSRVLLPLAAVGLIALPFAINDINAARQNAAWEAKTTAILKALPSPTTYTPAWTPPLGLSAIDFSCWDLPDGTGGWRTVVGNGDQMPKDYRDATGHRTYRNMRDIDQCGTTPNLNEELLQTFGHEPEPGDWIQLLIKYTPGGVVDIGADSKTPNPFDQKPGESDAAYCHRERVTLKAEGTDVAKFDCMINGVHYDNDPLSPLATT